MKKIFSFFGFKMRKKIFLAGLDGSGKGTLIQSLMDDQINQKYSDIDKFIKEDLLITTFDFGGCHMPYHCYKEFNERYDSIIFTVDASDSSRFAEAKDEFHVSLPKWEKIPILILGNKCDLETAVSREQLISALELTNMISIDNNQQPIQLFMCSAKSKTGYYEGFQWLKFFLN